MLQPSRRAFLRSLLALPIAAQVDLEKLLWTPGGLVSVPAPLRVASLEEINRITLEKVMPGLVDNLFMPTPLLAYLRDLDGWVIPRRSSLQPPLIWN